MADDAATAQHAVKYACGKRSTADIVDPSAKVPTLAGFNWKTVRVLSSSTLSSQDSSLLHLVLAVEQPDGTTKEEHLELNPEQVQHLISALDPVVAAL